MANVKEILQRTPPSVLYHYTTQQGLLGIISDKEIWATHTQYLNDAREFRHALDIVKQELSAMRQEPGRDEPAQKSLTEMHEALSPGMEPLTFVYARSRPAGTYSHSGGLTAVVRQVLRLVFRANICAM